MHLERHLKSFYFYLKCDGTWRWVSPLYPWSKLKNTMDYFCYISRSKVDQLYSALAPGEADEWTEQQSTEQNLDSSLNASLNIASIVSLFKGGVSYGRKGVIQRERKVKLQYTEKLRRVLIAAAKKSPIPALTQALGTGRFGSVYYHHQGSFTVSEALSVPVSNAVVTIQTKVEGNTLSLDCSLRFFSEGNEPDDSFALNSSNSRFFAGKIPLQMDSVFLILHRQPEEIVGTPLYLKLADTAGIAL